MHPFFETSPGSFKVKICGVTNRLDAEAAIEAGADALGFNIFPRSKRFVQLDRMIDWLADLPVQTCRIIVSVDASLADCVALVNAKYVDALQLHGDESPAYCQELGRFGKPLIKAFPAINPEIALRMRDFPATAVLLDSFRDAQFGGSGDTFEWPRFAHLNYGRPLILSGGLTPGNVAAAVRLFRPAAVDVASGVEQAPGVKDFAKMADFIAAAREAAREAL